MDWECMHPCLLLSRDSKAALPPKASRILAGRVFPHVNQQARLLSGDTGVVSSIKEIQHCAFYDLWSEVWGHFQLVSGL